MRCIMWVVKNLQSVYRVELENLVHLEKAWQFRKTTKYLVWHITLQKKIQETALCKQRVIRLLCWKEENIEKYFETRKNDSSSQGCISWISQLFPPRGIELGTSSVYWQYKLEVPGSIPHGGNSWEIQLMQPCVEESFILFYYQGDKHCNCILKLFLCQVSFYSKFHWYLYLSIDAHWLIIV